MRFNAGSLDAYQHLGRGAHDRDTAHADEIHVRRGVDVTERAIHREGIDGYFGFEPLREDDLVDVAGGNELFRRPHLRLELLSCVVRSDLECRRSAPVRARQASVELALQKLNLGARKPVERLQVVVRRDAGVGDDEDPVLHVIEGEHGIKQHEARLVGAVASAAKLAEHGLEPRRGAVPQIADRAAREAREVRHIRRLEVGHQAAQRVDKRPVALGHRTAPLHGGAAVARAQDQKRILAEKRVPPDVLAAFDALEEEGVVGVFGNLQERRHRRQQIRHDLLADGHKRATRGEIFELFKRRDLHRV